MEAPPLQIPGATRQTLATPSTEQLIDRLEEAECQFLRFLGPADYTLPEVSRVQACPAGGWLLEGQKAIFWLPRLPVARKLDQQGHILEETAAPILKMQLDASGLRLAFAPPMGFVTDLIVWQLSLKLKEELTDLTSIETQGYFLWGSHTRYDRPSDLYLHLIHGWVYENRAPWPKYWKICAENDAHALYVSLCGLERITSKTLYRLFKKQLILSVLSRQAQDGCFYHGVVTDNMESHFRLNTGAMHLLLDAYSEYPSLKIEHAIEHGLGFLIQVADQLEIGPFFLHDSLEINSDGLHQRPSRYLKSRAFGKSESNMLVLNTHLDTTVAIARAASMLHHQDFSRLARAASRTAHTLLMHRPAEWLYRLFFYPIALSFLPKERALALPIWKRTLKRLGWKYLSEYLCYIKQYFPRFTMPGGYIDRHLSFLDLSPSYHSINLMDLVRFAVWFPEIDLKFLIKEAINFAYSSGLWEQWSEDKKKHHALGFWAEALYRLSLIDSDPIWRQLLAETMLRLETLELGQPPSLLGGNHETGIVSLFWRSEAIPATFRLADLSRSNKPELLLINPSSEAITVNLEEIAPLTWQGSHGEALSGLSKIPPKAWVIGR